MIIYYLKRGKYASEIQGCCHFLRARRETILRADAKKKEKKKLPILHSLNLIAIFFWGAALLNCRIILPQRRHTDDLLKVF